MAAISDRIKMLRKANQLSQEDFSKKMNISRSTLALLESDKSFPSYDLIRNMVSEFNISATYFFDEKVYELSDYMITSHQGLKHATPKELKSIENNYFKEALKLKKELLNDSSLKQKHRDILDLLFELKAGIDELKEFSDTYIDLYDPERYTSFVKYLEDQNTLLSIEAYKLKIHAIIKRFMPYKVEIDLYEGETANFLKAMNPITEQ